MPAGRDLRGLPDSHAGPFLPLAGWWLGGGSPARLPGKRFPVSRANKTPRVSPSSFALVGDGFVPAPRPGIAQWMKNGCAARARGAGGNVQTRKSPVTRPETGSLRNPRAGLNILSWI